MSLSRPRYLKRFLFAIGLVGAAAFTAFVWPTQFRYDRLTEGGNSYPVRMNRFTGRSELFRGTWVDLNPRPSESAQSAAIHIPIDRLEFRGNVADYGWFSGRVFNHSALVLTSLIIRCSSDHTDAGVRWSRLLSFEQTVAPETSTDLLQEVSDRGIHDSQCIIERARGRTP
jgi:hypothetical protein